MEAKAKNDLSLASPAGDRLHHASSLTDHGRFARGHWFALTPDDQPDAKHEKAAKDSDRGNDDSKTESGPFLRTVKKHQRAQDHGDEAPNGKRPKAGHFDFQDEHDDAQENQSDPCVINGKTLEGKQGQK